MILVLIQTDYVSPLIVNLHACTLGHSALQFQALSLSHDYLHPKVVVHYIHGRFWLLPQSMIFWKAWWLKHYFSSQFSLAHLASRRVNGSRVHRRLSICHVWAKRQMQIFYIIINNQSHAVLHFTPPRKMFAPSLRPCSVVPRAVDATWMPDATRGVSPLRNMELLLTSQTIYDQIRNQSTLYFPKPYVVIVC